jgi:O-antigen/teichoic acid export membrane protein
VGTFGLFFATINLAMYAVGLDFYAFSTREILKASGAQVAQLIRNQLALHLVSYAAALPLFVLGIFIATSLLPMELAGWFCLLLVLEHLGQELQRVLVTLQRSTQAALSLFLRQGLWGIVVPLLMVLFPSARSLGTLWRYWSLCEVAGLLLAAWFLRDLAWAEARKRPIDWSWIRGGIRGALPFLTATVALTVMRTLDRYALKHFWGDEAVGVVTFFLFIRNAIQGLIDAGIVFVLQPRILIAHQRGQAAEYSRLMKVLLASVLGAACGLSGIAALLIRPVIALVARPEYGRALDVFWLVLVLTVVAAVSDVPHTALYARHFDRAIVWCALFGLLATAASLLLLVPTFAMAGSLIATTIGFAAMGLYGVGVLRYASSPDRPKLRSQ